MCTDRLSRCLTVLLGIGLLSGSALSKEDADALEGADAIAAAWQGLVDLPGLSLSLAPTRVVVSARGDMAADIGTYTLSYDGDGGRVEDNGKYVVVWRKVGGAWRVVSDIFNTSVAAQ